MLVPKVVLCISVVIFVGAIGLLTMMLHRYRGRGEAKILALAAMIFFPGVFWLQIQLARMLLDVQRVLDDRFFFGLMIVQIVGALLVEVAIAFRERGRRKAAGEDRPDHAV